MDDTPTTPADDRARADQDPPVDGAWRRLALAARPRATKANAVGAAVALLLGFAVATQVRQTRSQPLENLRQSDLIGILDGLNANAARLDDEARALQGTRDQLVSGSQNEAAAVAAARARLDALGILAGTVKATGPGIRMTITDPERKVTPPVLLDAIQELRDAGAEAIQVGTVRVVASTFVAVSDDGLRVDQVGLRSPYRVLAIGDSQTLASAMAIPGGIVETVRQLGASIDVREQDDVVVDALHTPREPRYARPDPKPSG